MPGEVAGPARPGRRAASRCRARSKYSTQTLAAVVELVEPARAPRRSRRRRAGSSTCTCVWPGSPCRSCTWSARSSSSHGSRPSRRRDRCRRAAAGPAPRRRNASTVSRRVHDRAGPRFEQRARRAPPPPHRPLPHAVAPRPAPASSTTRRPASGTRSGSRPATRATRDRSSSIGSMCVEPVGRRRSRARSRASPRAA